MRALLQLDLAERISLPIQRAGTSLSKLTTKYHINKKELSSLNKQLYVIDGYIKQKNTINDSNASINMHTKSLELLRAKEITLTDAINQQIESRNKLRSSIKRTYGSQVGIDPLKKQLADVDKTLQSMLEQRRKIKIDIVTDMKALDRLPRDIYAANNAIKLTEENLEKLGIKAKDAASGVETLRAKEKGLTEELEKQRTTLQILKTKHDEIQKSRAKTARIEQSAANTMVAGFGMQASGRSVFSALSKPLGTAVDFEKQMSAVKAKSGADSGEMQNLKKIALDLGAATSFSASEVASAQELLAMAGVKTQDITKSTLSGLLDVAKAGGLALEEATSVSTDVIQGFGLKMSQINDVGDILAYTANVSSTSVRDMGSVFKEVAPIAKTANIGLKEMSSMTAILANVGIRGSVAGTTLKNAILSLAAPASGGGKAIKSLGIAVRDSRGNMRPMVDILKHLAIATKDLGSAERAAILTEIAGRESLAGFTELVSKAGTEEGLAELNAIQSSMDKVSGSASRMGKILSDNAAGDIDERASAFEGLSISLGTLVLPIFREFNRAITKSLNFLTQYVETHQQGAKAFLAVGLGLGAVLTVGGALVIGLAAVQFSLAKVRGGIGLMHTGFGVAIRGMVWLARGVQGAIGATTAALKAMSLAGRLTMSAMGIGLLIGAAGLVYAYWDDIKRFFVSFWDDIKPIWKGFAEFIEGVFGPIWELLMGDQSPVNPLAKAAAGHDGSQIATAGGPKIPFANAFERFSQFGVSGPVSPNAVPANYSTPINIHVNGSVDESKLAARVRSEMDRAHRAMETRHRARLED